MLTGDELQAIYKEAALRQPLTVEGEEARELYETILANLETVRTAAEEIRIPAEAFDPYE